MTKSSGFSSAAACNEIWCDGKTKGRAQEPQGAGHFPAGVNPASVPQENTSQQGPCWEGLALAVWCGSHSPWEHS